MDVNDIFNKLFTILGVQTAFNGVAKTPEKVGEYTNMAVASVKSNFK